MAGQQVLIRPRQTRGTLGLGHPDQEAGLGQVRLVMLEAKAKVEMEAKAEVDVEVEVEVKVEVDVEVEG